MVMSSPQLQVDRIYIFRHGTLERSE